MPVGHDTIGCSFDVIEYCFDVIEYEVITKSIAVLM
jgi:hypothetical protein